MRALPVSAYVNVSWAVWEAPQKKLEPTAAKPVGVAGDGLAHPHIPVIFAKMNDLFVGCHSGQQSAFCSLVCSGGVSRRRGACWHAKLAVVRELPPRVPLGCSTPQENLHPVRVLWEASAAWQSPAGSVVQLKALGAACGWIGAGALPAFALQRRRCCAITAVVNADTVPDIKSNSHTLSYFQRSLFLFTVFRPVKH